MELTQQLLNGLTLGLLYALIALGYTLVYGILELINFAHGEIMMFGAFFAYAFMVPLGHGSATGMALLAAVATAVAFYDRLKPTRGWVVAATGAASAATLLGYGGYHLMRLELNFLLSVLLALPYAAVMGAALERIAYRPLRGQNRLIPLISAIGASIFLQNLAQIDPWFFGTRRKTMPLPSWLTGEFFSYGQLSISNLQVVIFVVSIATMAGLYLFIRRTRLGTAIRATAQNRKVASLMGIDTNGVIVLTFMLGSVLAAIAGVLYAAHLGTVSPYMGYIAGIKAFTAAVLGGIGNVPGAMIGGVLLGVLESLGAAYIDPGYKDAIAFGILIVVLLFRPNGIMGASQKEKV